MLNELDLTELTFIQCLLKISMDELERDPDVCRGLTGMFTLETARSVEMKIAQYIDNLESKHGYR